MSIDSAYLGAVVAALDEVNRKWSLDVAFTPVSVAATTTAWQDVTITGLTSDDVIEGASPGADLAAGLSIVGIRYKSAGIASIGYGNSTGSPIVPAANTYRFTMYRKQT